MTFANDPKHSPFLNNDLFDEPAASQPLPTTLTEWQDHIKMDTSVRLLNGCASYYPSFLPEVIADQCLREWQASLPWQQNTIKIYGKDVVIPRMEAWLGETGLRYQYSGKQLSAKAWPSSIESLAEALGHLLQTKFNSVLANLYRSGDDSMGWHSDDEIELGLRPIIASVTLGQARDFAFRIKGQSKMHSKLSLAHGSLLIMHAGMQEQWQHALPKRRQSQCPRVNLTFRQILQARG